MSFVYPRLTHDAAMRIATPMIEGNVTVDEMRSEAATRHPRAAPVATGGTPATEAMLGDLRDGVLGVVSALGRRSSSSDFDLAVGRALHDGLTISRADAGSPGVWNFINLVLLPDVALARFPRPTKERLVGAGPRNALRRMWLRFDVLGDAIMSGPRLSEDELVGLTERTSLVRNRTLAKFMAAEVVRRPGRPEVWAREFYRIVRWKTGPLLLDVIPNESLQAMIHEVGQVVDRSVGYRPPEDAPRPWGRDLQGTGRAITDVELSRAVVHQYSAVHNVSDEVAQSDLHHMIRQFASQATVSVEHGGRKQFARHGYTLTVSSDGDEFVGYAPGAESRWPVNGGA